MSLSKCVSYSSLHNPVFLSYEYTNESPSLYMISYISLTFNFWLKLFCKNDLARNPFGFSMIFHLKNTTVQVFCTIKPYFSRHNSISVYPPSAQPY